MRRYLQFNCQSYVFHLSNFRIIILYNIENYQLILRFMHLFERKFKTLFYLLLIKHYSMKFLLHPHHLRGLGIHSSQLIPLAPQWSNLEVVSCPPGDLNPHDISHWYLEPARLPIPPGGLVQHFKERTE